MGMAKLEQGTDVDITNYLLLRSWAAAPKALSPQVGRVGAAGRAKLSHAQGSARALWASLQQQQACCGAGRLSV